MASQAAWSAISTRLYASMSTLLEYSGPTCHRSAAVTTGRHASMVRRSSSTSTLSRAAASASAISSPMVILPRRSVLAMKSSRVGGAWSAMGHLLFQVRCKFQAQVVLRDVAGDHAGVHDQVVVKRLAGGQVCAGAVDALSKPLQRVVEVAGGSAGEPIETHLEQVSHGGAPPRPRDTCTPDAPCRS